MIRAAAPAEALAAAIEARTGAGPGVFPAAVGRTSGRRPDLVPMRKWL